MGIIILWGIGIIVYLLIGFGYMHSGRKIHKEIKEPINRYDAFILILVWPFEVGCLIARASVYLESERVSLYGGLFGLGGKPFKQKLLDEIVELKIKLSDIEKAIHNIENTLQKK